MPIPSERDLKMNNLVRDMFKSYVPYKPSPQEYDIILNANENPENLLSHLPQEQLNKLINEIQYNRYPESDNIRLRKAYAKYIGKDMDNIIAGVGSDEILHMIADVFLDYNDYALAAVPTFSMYKHFVEIAKGNFIEIAPKNDDLEPDIDAMIDAANQYKAKIIFICTPNNPTGYLWKQEDIIRVIENTSSMVVIDEAYIDFAKENNMDLIDTYSRVIVLRTLSKAFALAGARVGFAVADKETIGYLSLAKVPFNLNVFSQYAAELMLENTDIIKKQVNYLINERNYLIEKLKSFEQIKVYPSAANYILITSPYAHKIFLEAEKNKISLRNFSNEIPNTLRISVGSRNENNKVLEIITEVLL